MPHIEIKPPLSFTQDRFTKAKGQNGGGNTILCPFNLFKATKLTYYKVCLLKKVVI